MKEMISLKPMTPEMYHAFFQEYENDMDLYLDKNDFTEYVYNREKVDAYIQKQISLKRLPFAIMCGEEMVGELKLYDIVSGKSATLGITMKSKKYKDKGYGTQAERLAIDFLFNELDIPVLYADSILTNTRSQHVLEKVGFQFLYADEQRKHYRITKDK
ncbi:MAG: GNAT family N-acetyltransferase [Clostridia bacterium]|nr:GNAT family N-acetyltransferase [Clostridia bacterium]